MSEPNRKSALVVEGGGMRGIFAAGVLRAFANAGFDPFDLYIGVSVGACHLASHLAGQYDRNLEITLRYSLSRRFINPWRFLRGGHLMDLDWMWEQTIHHDRLDLPALFETLRLRNKEYLIVATSMETGQALYLRPGPDTLEHFLKVSSAIPVLYRKVLKVGGEKATDGGVVDAIPVREAHRRGATDITVIRSRPADYVKKESAVALAVLSLHFQKYPSLMEQFRRRADVYNAAVRFVRCPPPGVRVAEIAPPSDMDVARITRDEARLRAAYAIGMDCGAQYLRARAAASRF
jgi:predicted patatin/cPLA2 family phospholipase